MKKRITNVPFYSNTEDGTYCYQASLLSVLTFFRPELDINFKTLNKLTDKQEGLWTWPQAGLVSVLDLGLDLVIISRFDYNKFIEGGVSYIEKEYGQEVAQEQQKNSNISNAIKHSEELLKRDTKFEKSPTIQLLKKYLSKGYLIICNVNLAKLNNRQGYIGHFVTVYKIDENEVHFHDPGQPPSIPAVQSRREKIEVFNEAWSISKDAYAIGKKKAVVFDLDGVYFQNGTEKFISSVVRKYKVNKDLVVDTYLKSEEMQKTKRGEMTQVDYWHYFKRSLGISDSTGSIVALLISSYQVNSEIQNFVMELRKKGVKTVICTNNFPDRFEGLKSKFNLNKYFDVMITSYEIGVTKPSEEIFRILASRLEMAPKRILMCDDRETNVKSLQDLGFEAFLFKGLDDFIQKVNYFLEK